MIVSLTSCLVFPSFSSSFVSCCFADQVLFDIPDIRLFWSQDQRFLSQFQAGKITKFVSFSKFPPVFKDVSFWLPAPPAGEKAAPPAVSASAAPLCDNDIYEVTLLHQC